ncbi:MAG: signal peptide peptidase SppA [Rhodospirillales bacterium]|jgi:protease-4|nr:signal peptide peptidase SppA [Rhodospirillales bacterium]HIJ43618.1 signal peptide peptidase SppA [Rhodospirillaceae bacterium]MDP7215087.1 signal peptide peptidase SppA [Rhodospirillales bacterium]HIJ45473.1 signal peptide peptidase SppA [Rhodospirillaceae bacterium]HIJ93579.1 signal peptide peptidase SppA [Rhodospirillaceae bacterium]
MSLDADRIIDRRRLKRHLIFWRIATVVSLIVVGVVALERMGKLRQEVHVARLSVEGIILDDPWRDKALEQVRDNDKAKALIVRIDSPGGTVVGGEALFHGLRAMAAKKPVVAVMSGTATSAGYMAALGAEYIVAREATITGSIGVIMQTADMTQLLEKLGIKPESIKSGELKAQPNPLEPFTPAAREAVKVVVLDLFEMFVGMVEKRRKIPREQVLKLADGRVFTGRQAEKNGLVDTIGGERKAREWLRDSFDISTKLPVKDVEIQRDDEPWRDILTGMVGKTLFSERLRLDGLISLWHPELR